MSGTAPSVRAMPAERISELLQLSRAADGVELKVAVPEDDHRSAIVALGMDPIDAQIRQVFFFDTPDLALDRHGLVVRARRIQGKGEDSAVTLRPVVPAELPGRFRTSPNLRVEVDALPGGFVCSATMRSSRDGARVRRAVAGELPTRKLFSKEQREFFGHHVPPGLGLGDLMVLGPIFVLRLRQVPGELGRRLVAEMWIYPDGSRVLELSTRCGPGEAVKVASESRALLAERGIDLSGEQQAKTRTALEYFAGAARNGAVAAP
jgi:hypothetical protein